jgi:hypothetical protein
VNGPDPSRRALPREGHSCICPDVFAMEGRKGPESEGGQEVTVTVLAMFLLIIGALLMLLGTVLVVVGVLVILMGMALIAVAAFLLIRRVLGRRQ